MRNESRAVPRRFFLPTITYALNYQEWIFSSPVSFIATIGLELHPYVKGLQQPRGWGLSKAFCLFWRLGEFSASTAVMFAFNIPVWRFLMSLPD